MTYQPHSAFAELFRAFTSDPASIGNQLTQQMMQREADTPLLVSTASDVALFPGGGRPASIESFRKSTRGFIELTAVSHLPLAIAYLARMRELAPHDYAWQRDAAKLMVHARKTREANSPALWRDEIAIQSLAGFDVQLANLVDYTCGTTIDLLERVADEPSLMTFDSLRDRYFAPLDPDTVPVPMNDVMFATFGLAFLDIVYRIGNWLRAQEFDWPRLMVLVSGRSGRPTAGATWATNNMCHLIWRVSGGALPPERLFVAPHAPSFSVAELPDAAGLAALENTYRMLWLNTRASIDVARELFPDHPGYRFEPAGAEQMPPITSVNDRDATTARLRRIMEDPTQLLSNCVADYIVDQLQDNGNRPDRVEIPGFTNVTYPGPSS
ncbi:DUF5624 domain-containing protein [Caballeronia mineralivorans]|jgi:hypothetical protein|uniref:DUF5624 domain-containing protein n=1 Tax=Caballeronia mineralivorans TaxID=2010198 RepID=UPI002AFEE1C4|nr:DUF5624 domain-containing protein [Caballeronia mineralivorans]MEA3097008.1 hypothetical protein [Caballeronia mineralivorans]